MSRNKREGRYAGKFRKNSSNVRHCRAGAEGFSLPMWVYARLVKEWDDWEWAF